MRRSAGTLFLAVLCFLSVLSAAEPCPAGWTFNSANNHCYNLEATASPVTWVQARAACAAYNVRTTLVTPGSQVENDYVYNYVKTEKAYNGNIWIGLEGNDAYAASGNETCSAALITPSMGRKYSGSIGTGTGTVDPYGNCDMPGKENFFRFTAGVGGTWTFKVTSTFDAVIDLYSGACASYLSCRDNSGANTTETMTYTLTAGQTYTVVVDKYKTTDSGTYTLEIMSPPDNGKRAFSWIDNTDTTYTNWDSGEPNNSGGAEACAELKIGTTTYGKWNDVPCDSSGALHAYVCEYVSSICGDTVVEGIEECDDGNLTDGDGCDSNCRPTGCGNGLVTAGEQCDDGNVIDLDGCKNDCTLPCPDGWVYSTATGNCYNLYGVGDTKTWIEADAACETAYGNGTTLATIGDATENAFIFNYVKNTKAYNGNIWLGMEGETAYPSFGNETCSTAWMAPSMGRKYSGSIGTGTGTVDPYGWCDMPGKENFFRFTAGVSGYWRFSVYSTFDAVIDLYSGACTSYMDCEDYYGANATDWMEYPLTAGQVYTVVVDKYSTSDSGTYTLDIMPPTDRGKKAFSWIDDTDTTYTNWDTNEPSGGTEGCVEMKITTTTNAKWNDLACNSSSVKLAYTCETTGNILALQNKEAITTLDLSNRGLTSLEGIEVFANLQVLNIAGNPVTALEPLRYLIGLQQITGTPQDGGSNETVIRITGEALYDFIRRAASRLKLLPPFIEFFYYQEREQLEVYYNFEQSFRSSCILYDENPAAHFCQLYSGEVPNVAPGYEDTYDGQVYMTNEEAFSIVSAGTGEQWYFGKKGAFYTSAVLGVGDYITTYYAVPSGSFTVSVRSAIPAGQTDPMELIRIGNWGENDFVLSRVGASLKVNGNEFSPVGDRVAFPDADQIVLVCTRSDVGCALYFNGMKQSLSFNIMHPSGYVAIGYDHYGTVDEFRIHNEALWEEEIRNLYFFHICPINKYHDMTDHGVCRGRCGDWRVAVGDEECDDGANGNNCDGCLDNCTLHTGSCGDGFICDDEECDDGIDNGLYGYCRADCSGMGPYCGDGLVQTEDGETCDDGNTVTESCPYGETSCVVCNAACQEVAGVTIAYCGDGFVNGPEECEDGNFIDGDGCDSNCTFTGCGNGIVTAGEICDDGNFNDADDCTSTCIAAFCGDGLLHVGVEECDDGNSDNCDACQNGCIKHISLCGNGCIEGKEECDDGNLVNGDLCNSKCENYNTGFCGSTPVYFGAGMRGWTQALSGTTGEQQAACQLAAGLWENYCSMASDGSNAFNCCVVNRCSNVFEVTPGSSVVATLEDIQVTIPPSSLPGGASSVRLEKSLEHSDRMAKYIANVTGGLDNAKQHYKVVVDNDPTLQLTGPISIEIGYEEWKLADPDENSVALYVFSDTSERWVKLDNAVIDINQNKVMLSVAEGSSFYAGQNNIQSETPEKKGINILARNNDIKDLDPLAGITEITPPTPNNHGVASITYPLNVPSDSDSKPDLKLAYSSDGNKSGNVGMGWNVSVSTISVSTKDGIPNYNAESTLTYLLDGKELVLVDEIRENDTLRSVFRVKNESTFEKVVKDENNLFHVYTVGGNEAIYGDISNLSEHARLEVPGSNGKIYKWYITKAVDKYGNEIKYEYRKAYNQYASEPQGWVVPEWYPSKIKYGHEDQFQISFLWEVRPDPRISGIGGLLIQDTLRLSAIYMMTDKGNAFVRSYALTYNSTEALSESLYRSVLEKITEKTPGDEIINEHVFAYSSLSMGVDGNPIKDEDRYYNRTTDLYSANLLPITVDGFDHRLRDYKKEDSKTKQLADMVDINGDGLPDYIGKYVVESQTVPGEKKIYVRLNNNTAWFADHEIVADDEYMVLGIEFPAYLSYSDDKDSVLRLSDYNGDGLLDYVGKSKGTGPLVYALNRGDHFGIAETDSINGIDGDGFSLGNGETYSYMDMNGDGHPDFVIKNKDDDHFRVHYYQKDPVWGSYYGSPITVPVEDWSAEGEQRLTLVDPFTKQIPPRNNLRTKIDLQDINGDGLPDWIAKSGSDSFYVQMNAGSRFVLIYNPSLSGEVYAESGLNPGFCYPDLRCAYIGDDGGVHQETDFLDINGDGLPDRIGKRREGGDYSPNYFVAFNTGQGFVEEEWNNPMYANPSYQDFKYTDSDGDVRLDNIDMDGDGCPDRVFAIVPGQDAQVNIFVQRNNMCDKNILIGVTNNKTGTEIKLGYERVNVQNNEGITDIKDLNYSKKLVLKNITYQNGLVTPVYRKNTEINYYDGVKDRTEKTFRGFEKLETITWHEGDSVKQKKLTTYATKTLQLREDNLYGDIPCEYLPGFDYYRPRTDGGLLCRCKTDDAGLYCLYDQNIGSQPLKEESYLIKGSQEYLFDRKEYNYLPWPVFATDIYDREKVKTVVPIVETSTVIDVQSDPDNGEISSNLVGYLETYTMLVLQPNDKGLPAYWKTWTIQNDKYMSPINWDNTIEETKYFTSDTNGRWLNLPILEEAVKISPMTPYIQITQPPVTIPLPSTTNVVSKKYYEYDNIDYGGNIFASGAKASEGILTATYVADIYRKDGIESTTYRKTAYTYNAEGRMLTEAGPDGLIKKWEYSYPSGGSPYRIERAYLPARNNGHMYYEEKEYDALNRITKITDLNGVETKLWYDAIGRVIEEQKFYRDNWVVTRQHQYQQVDERHFGIRSKFANPTSTGAHQMVIDQVVDMIGRPYMTIRDVEVHQTSNGEYTTPGLSVIVSGIVNYDRAGRVVSKGRPWATYRSGAGSNILCSFTTPAPTEGKTFFTYDVMGRIQKIVHPTDIVSYQSETKEVLEQTFESWPGGSLSTKILTRKKSASDNQGRLAEDWFFLQAEDQNEPIHSAIWYTKTDNTRDVHETKIHSDLLGFSMVIEPTGLVGKKWKDTMGKVRALETPDAGLTEYVYDDYGRLTEKREYGYAATSPRVIEISYDSRNRLIRVNYPDNTGDFSSTIHNDLAYEYYDDDPNTPPFYRNTIKSISKGKLIEIGPSWTMDPVDYRTELSYGQNWVEEEKTIEGVSYVTKHTYDIQDRITQIDYPNGQKAHYEYYDRGGFLMEIYVADALGGNRTDYLSNITYNESNQRMSLLYGNGTATHYSYDPRSGLLRKMDIIKNSQKIMSYTYHFDEAGNLKELFKEDNIGNGGPIHISETAQSYDYDISGTLKSSMGTSFLSDDQYDEQYQFDGSYRILAKNDGAYNYAFDYAKDCDNISARDNHGVKCIYKMKDETTYQKSAFSYNRFGNMIEKADLTSNGNSIREQFFEYDNDNRIAQIMQKSYVKASDGQTELSLIDSVLEFTYDDRGQRLTKRVYSGVDWLKKTNVYVNGVYSVETMEDDPLGLSEIRISDGSHIVASVKMDDLGQEVKTRYWTQDNIGSTILLTDGQGVVTNKYSYKPFGEPWAVWTTEEENPVLDGLNHAGNDYDPETALYYRNARYYDPDTVAFTTPDPVMDGYNHYGYVKGNPIKYTDPTGKFFLLDDILSWCFFKLIGTNKTSFKEGLLKNFKNSWTLLGNLAAQIAIKPFMAIAAAASMDHSSPTARARAAGVGIMGFLTGTAGIMGVSFLAIGAAPAGAVALMALGGVATTTSGYVAASWAVNIYGGDIQGTTPAGNMIVGVPSGAGPAFSMGGFIIGDNSPHKKDSSGKEIPGSGGNLDTTSNSYDEIIKHEYGHYLQFLMLGDFYLPIIAAHSVAATQKYKGKEYCDFFTEEWSNLWMGITSETDKKKVCHYQ